MASPARPSAKRIAAAPPPISYLDDDLLVEILLRLPILADIGRAAASCSAFRRVAAGRDFLRRLRSVHPAPLLGLVRFVSIHPAEPPHSAPYALAFAGAADLSFSFLPFPGSWFPLDVCDGRVLLKRFGISRHEFVVCDPLFRRYTLLPQIPEDQFWQLRSGIKPFLVPASQETEASFSVVFVAKDASQQQVAFVFSSVTGEWSGLAMGAGVQVQPCRKMTGPRGYAYGCFYWKLDGTDNLIVFDTRSMEFSWVHIPFSQDQQQQDLVIVEAGGGRLGMFTLDNSIISAVSRLFYAIQEIDEVGSSRWRIERRIRLPSQNLFSFEDATDRYLLLRGTPWNLGLVSNMDDAEIGYFSFELEAMQIEKMCAINDTPYAKLYPHFPPSLCLPTV